MTREEKIDARDMILAGCTYNEVAKKYNSTAPNIYRIVKNPPKRISRKEPYVYINIEKWMVENYMTQTCLARKLGITKQTLCKKLRGKLPFNRKDIEKMLEITGMPIEKCFYRSNMEMQIDIYSKLVPENFVRIDGDEFLLTEMCFTIEQVLKKEDTSWNLDELYSYNVAKRLIKMGFVGKYSESKEIDSYCIKDGDGLQKLLNTLYGLAK